MDISTLAVQVKSDGVDAATKALLDYALAADKANDSTDTLSKKSVDLSTSTKNAGGTATEYANKTVSANASIDQSYSKLQRQADAYYAGLEKAQARGNALNAAGTQAQELKKLQEAQATLTRMTKELSDADDKLQRQLRQSAYMERIGQTKALSAAQGEAIAMNRKMGEEMDGFTKKTSHAASGTAGITREFIVLAHEMSQGQFSRFGGSMLVMAEKFDTASIAVRAFKVAQTSVGGSALVAAGLITGVVVAVIALGIAIYKTLQEASKFRELQADLVMTGNFAGATADQMQDMAVSIGNASGSIASATKTVMELAKTGKFTASQISIITEAVVGLEYAAGIPIKDTIKAFESLAKGVEASTVKSTQAVSKNAAELNDHYHYLTEETYARIRELEKEGDSYGALALSVKTFADSNKERTAEIEANMTASMRKMHEWKQSIANWWAEIGHVQTEGSKRQDLQERVDWVKGKTGSLSPEHKKAVQDLADFDENATIASANAALKGNESRKVAEKIHNDYLFDMMVKQNDKTAAAVIKIEQFKAYYATKSYEEQIASKKDYETTLAKLEKDAAGKVVKEKSVGLSGVNAEVKEIEAAYAIQKSAVDNELKLLEFKHKYHLVSEQQFEADKEKLLDKQIALEMKSYTDELVALKDFHGKTQTERNNDLSKIADLTRKKQILIDKTKEKEAELALRPAALLQAADDAEQKHADTMIKSLTTQTDLLVAKNKAYDSLSDSAKRHGVTEKQMADEVTQAEIDVLQVKYNSIEEGDRYSEFAHTRELARIQAEIDAYKKKRDQQTILENNAETNRQALERTAAEKSISTAKLMEDAFKRAFKGMEDALVEFVMTGKLNFKDLVSSMIKDLLRIQIRDYLKNMMGDGSAIRSFFGMGGSSGGSSSGGGTSSSGGGNNPFSSMGTNAGGMVTKAGDFFGSNSMSSFGVGMSAGSSSGLDAMSRSAASTIEGLPDAGLALRTVDSATASLGAAAGELLNSVGSVLPYAGAIKSLLDGNVITAAATAAGAYFGGPIGAAIGQAVGAWVEKQFQGEMRYGGGYNYKPGGEVQLAGGPSGGEIAGAQTRAAIKTTADTLQTWLANAGSTALVTGFTAGLESSKNGKGTVFAGGSVNGVGFGTSDPTKLHLGSQTPEEAVKAFTIEIKRAALEGLQSAHVGGFIENYLAKLGPLDKITADQVNSAEAMINTVSSFVAVLKTLPDQFSAIKNASVESSLSIATMTGGISSLGTKLASYYNNFYTPAEKAAKVTTDITKALSDVGLVMPKTRDEFRGLMDSLKDLNDPASQLQYSTLLNNADAFSNLNPVINSVTDSLKKHTEALKVQLLTASGDKAGAAAAQYTIDTKDLSAADKAIFDFNKGIQDQIDLYAEIKSQHVLDIGLLTAQGKVSQALNVTRADTLSLLTGEQKVRQQEIYAAEDANAQRKLDIQLLTTEGRAQTALNATRADVLKSLAGEQKIRQQQIYDAEDANTQRQLDIQLMTAQGHAEAALNATREDALVKLSETQAATQKAIYAAEDANAQRQLDIQLMTAVGNAEGALAATRADALSKLTATQAVTQKAIYAAEDAVKAETKAKNELATAKTNLQTAYSAESSALQTTITNLTQFTVALSQFQKSLLTGALSPLTQSQQNTEARNQFYSTSAAAAGGDANAMSSLQGVTTTYLTSLKSQSVTAVDYAVKFSEVTKELTDTLGAASARKSIAQQQLDAMNAAIGGILTVNGSVLSVKDALAAYNSALSDQLAATAALAKLKDAAAATATPVADPKPVTTAATTAATSAANSATQQSKPSAVGDEYAFIPGVNDFASKLASAQDIAKITGMSVDDAISGGTKGHTVAYWKAIQDLYDAGKHPTTATVIPGFAQGGSFGGGIRLVGEQGPEIEATGPSRIFTAAQTREMMGGGKSAANDETVKQLASMRSELNAALIAVAQNTGKFARLLDRWEGGGLPPTRAAS